jgi:hypothetical protein
VAGVRRPRARRLRVCRPCLQKRLLRVREVWARSVGYTVAITYTAHSNNASSNSLISAGYKLYTPERQWGLEHALYWRKNLDATR